MQRRSSYRSYAAATIASCAILLLSACGDSSHDHEDPSPNATIMQKGSQHFTNHCAGCHGAEGAGDIGPNLYERVPLHTDDELRAVITNGTGNMPAVALADASAFDTLIPYLRATFGAVAGPDDGHHDDGHDH